MSTATPINPATFVPLPGVTDPIVTQMAHAIYAADIHLQAPTLESERELAASAPDEREHYVLLAEAAYRVAARKHLPHGTVENFAG